MHGRREDVVRRLTHVHVVVGVHVVAGQRSDYLIRVHVRGRARAGLEDIDRKLIVELACGNAVAGLRDALGLLFFEQPQFGVRFGCRLLDESHRPQEAAWEALSGDREVEHRALRRRPVQRVCGDLDLAHGIPFDAGVRCLRRTPRGRSVGHERIVGVALCTQSAS